MLAIGIEAEVCNPLHVARRYLAWIEVSVVDVSGMSDTLIIQNR